MFTTGTSAEAVANQVIQVLAGLRNALDLAHDAAQWSAGIAHDDLVTFGFPDDDASALQSALADADALYDYYSDGLPPGTYPQPSSSYVYGNSQRLLIGARKS